MLKNNEIFISSADLEKQEHLGIENLKIISNEYSVATGLEMQQSRPKESFLELMNWVSNWFSSYIRESNDYTFINKFVHNRILIDGQFMQYCKLNNITITPLLKDGIVSWKSEHNYEKFFAQGIFLIQSKSCRFLSCALFHKGNQNEDEISFFILCSDKNYEKYIELRNDFDDWTVKRDRENLHIKVIEGEDIPYTQDQSWNDLFLPKEIKTEIKHIVEGFLSSKDFYYKNKICWKRGILMFGPQGNGKTSIIRTIISNYNFKPITISTGSGDDAMQEAFAYAETQSPSLLYIEDLDSLLEGSINLSLFLNLMDGINSNNGLLVIATANDISKLPLSITDRPSRFDRKIEVKLPTQRMAYIYLKNWFSNIITTAQIKELSKLIAKYKFSYASIKELFVSSMFESISNDRKIPTKEDIYQALDRLLLDKKLIKSASSVSTEKYFNKINKRKTRG